MAYSVEVLPSVEKDLRNLPTRLLPRIEAKIESLAIEPRPHGSVKLRGSKDRYRVRQGSLRILYRIDNRRKRVIVYSVADRKDAYR